MSHQCHGTHIALSHRESMGGLSQGVHRRDKCADHVPVIHNKEWRSKLQLLRRAEWDRICQLSVHNATWGDNVKMQLVALGEQFEIKCNFYIALEGTKHPPQRVKPSAGTSTSTYLTSYHQPRSSCAGRCNWALCSPGCVCSCQLPAVVVLQNSCILYTQGY